MSAARPPAPWLVRRVRKAIATDRGCPYRITLEEITAAAGRSTREHPRDRWKGRSVERRTSMVTRAVNLLGIPLHYDP